MKRLIDLIGASLGLITFSVLLLILVAISWRLIGGPVFFAQIRPGYRGHPFKMWKFRTMNEVRGDSGELLPDSVRITAFGRWLRSTSLDELPELWNVLRGDMSLVGPRPLLMEYLPIYNAEQARRHDVRPGITGWAQVNGRNAICWEEKFKLDVWYVDNHSLRLDIKILCLTVKKVLMREGISAAGEATMQKFTGSE